MNSNERELHIFIEKTVEHLMSINKKDYAKISEDVFNSFITAKFSASQDLKSIIKEFDNV